MTVIGQFFLISSIFFDASHFAPPQTSEPTMAMRQMEERTKEPTTATKREVTFGCASGGGGGGLLLRSTTTKATATGWGSVNIF